MSNKIKELLLIASILTGTILAPINSTMISVALSSISSYFHESLANISWVVTIYLIVMAVTQPIAGKLGDLFGNRNIYVWGLSLFFISSIACAFSINLPWLIVFRSLQAVGGALITPNATAIMRHALSKERLPKAFGLFGMGMGLGAAVGPLLGASLIGEWGWKSIFWVNVPFLFFALLTSIVILPKIQKQTAVSLDIAGSIYLAVSFSALILLTHRHSLMVYTLIALLFALFSALFVKREIQAQVPLIDFSLFKNHTFLGANLSILVSNFIMYTTLLMMPLLLEDEFNYSHQTIGWVMAAFSVSMSLSGWLGGQLTARIGNRKMIAVSFCIAVGSAALYFGLKPVHSLAYIIIALSVGGIAGGIGSTAMQTASLESVSKEMSGTASGIYSTFRYFGSMISSTLVSMLAGSSSLFAVLLVAAILGLIISRLLSNPDISFRRGQTTAKSG
ncbi:MFS transporter [Fictibacillus gelatini]|uniref:MFS transporter n=1 Tax=Fictibacillus gelatini TaxID=225985 RepID=UPI000410FC11|nr:MFS transporter [Fictibacillus gelatini]